MYLKVHYIIYCSCQTIYIFKVHYISWLIHFLFFSKSFLRLFDIHKVHYEDILVIHALDNEEVFLKNYFEDHCFFCPPFCHSGKKSVYFWIWCKRGDLRLWVCMENIINGYFMYRWSLIKYNAWIVIYNYSTNLKAFGVSLCIYVCVCACVCVT